MPHKHQPPIYSEEDKEEIVEACICAVLNDHSLWEPRELMKNTAAGRKGSGVFEKTLARQVLEFKGHKLEDIIK